MQVVDMMVAAIGFACFGHGSLAASGRGSVGVPGIAVASMLPHSIVSLLV
jgi:hypothetical protein